MKEKSKAIFEIDDRGREKGYETEPGSGYSDSFHAFLRQLGYKTSIRDSFFSKSQTATINGEKVYINYESAAYMGYQPYGRKYSIRKTRQIVIGNSSYDPSIKAIIPINKEFDATRMHEKIEQIILDQSKIRLKIIEERQARIVPIRKMYNHLKKIGLQSEITQISFNNKYISVTIQNGGISCGNLSIDMETGKPGEFHMAEIPTKTIEDIKRLPILATDIKSGVLFVINAIEKNGIGITKEELEQTKENHTLYIDEELDNHTHEAETYLRMMFDMEALARKIGYADGSNKELDYPTLEKLEAEDTGEFEQDLIEAAINIPSIMKEIHDFKDKL